MKKPKKSGIKLWFSLDSGQDDPSEWSTINVDIEDVGLTEEQASAIGEELEKKECFKIHSWVTNPTTFDKIVENFESPEEGVTVG